MLSDIKWYKQTVNPTILDNNNNALFSSIESSQYGFGYENILDRHTAEMLTK
jgi:hypothetical protein